MKKATCNDLRGACDEVITGESAEEMGYNSRTHVMKMIGKGDKAHQDAVEDMKKLSPEEQQKWYQAFKSKFNDLEDV